MRIYIRTLGTYKARVHFDLMPSIFHTLSQSLSSSYQTNTIYSHFLKTSFNFCMRVPWEYILISDTETSWTQSRYTMMQGRIYWLPCLLCPVSALNAQNKLWQKENMIFMAIHVSALGRWLSPLAELTCCAVAPFTILADKSSTYQSLCTHRHDIAIYSFQGVAGLYFMGPGFY